MNFIFFILEENQKIMPKFRDREREREGEVVPIYDAMAKTL